jgi:hypothetical protein
LLHAFHETVKTVSGDVIMEANQKLEKTFPEVFREAPQCWLTATAKTSRTLLK